MQTARQTQTGSFMWMRSRFIDRAAGELFAGAASRVEDPESYDGIDGMLSVRKTTAKRFARR